MFSNIFKYSTSSEVYLGYVKMETGELHVSQITDAGTANIKVVTNPQSLFFNDKATTIKGRKEQSDLFDDSCERGIMFDFKFTVPPLTLTLPRNESFTVLSATHKTPSGQTIDVLLNWTHLGFTLLITDAGTGTPLIDVTYHDFSYIYKRIDICLRQYGIGVTEETPFDPRRNR